MHSREVRSVCDIIDEWAYRQPDHTAILYDTGRKVTYRQLNDAASRVAGLLAQKNVGPGDLVPVLATRSPEMVASFLGVLKAGACYVPLDIEAWGAERIRSTLKRVSASANLSLPSSPSARVMVNLGETDASGYPEYEVVARHEVEATFEPLPLNKCPARGEQQPQQLPQTRIQAEDLAYLIFTSGTTSTPKGVMIPHRALLNYVQHGDEEAPFNANARPEDITLLIFSPGFDACTGLVFTMLCQGAQVMIPSTSDFLSCLPRVTILTATPSVLAAVQDPQTCSQLRTIVLGGEAPPPWLIEKWCAPDRNIYNGYGPTETTILSLIGRVQPGKPVTLGRSMPNSRVVLLDGDVESNEGEICITGPGLALGYYQDEAMTKQKFVSWKGEKMYKTGDFARRTQHGLEFCGRADSYVKNRGFLINLESQVIPMLLKAGALTATAFMHRTRLIAFVTPSILDTRLIRQELSRHHDAYLVPDQMRAIDALPLTVNGKADNRALQQMIEVEMETEVSTNSLHPAPKRSKVDLLRAAIAEATLLPLSEVTSGRSFFELGGNSLAGLKVLSYLQRNQLKLSLRALFELPDLKAVEEKISEIDARHTALDEQASSSRGPMTALQSRMIRASLRSPGANYMLLRINIPHQATHFDPDHFMQAWMLILKHHTIFRTTFVLKDELQVVKPDLVLDWSSEYTTADQLDQVIRARSLEINRRMLSIDDLSETFEPINAFRLITVSEVGSTLLVSAHHAQADGWSMSIVLQQVYATLYENSQLPLLNNPPFMAVALAQNQQQINPEGLSFWNDCLRNPSDLPRLRLPQSEPLSERAAELSGSHWTCSQKVSLVFTGQELEDTARLLRVTPSTLIYTAWGLVLSNYTFSDSISFGAVFSGRNLMGVSGVEQVVGPLLNTVPFPIMFDQQCSTVADTVSKINNHLLQMLEFQWSAPEAMKSMDAESIDRAMQSIVVTEYDLPSLPGSWNVERHDLMEFGLSLLLERDDNNKERLQAHMLFDGSLYSAKGIGKLLNHFKSALRELIDQENKYIQEVRTKVMCKEEKHHLLQPRNGEVPPYTGPGTVVSAFEAAAAKWPQLCAVESVADGNMTYKELDEAANRVAQWLSLNPRLMQGDNSKEKVVGVLADGSLYWIVSILAILKAGHICCTIDVGLPSRRISTIVEQSNCSIFLASNRRCAKAFPKSQDTDVANLLIVDEYLQDPPDDFISPPNIHTKPEDTIYLVFTSGSTGIPKGVALHNKSILHVLEDPQTRLFSAPGRRNAQLLGLGFDVATVEIFGSLCYGATLVLKDPNNPFEHLKRVNATMATPSFLSAIPYSQEDHGSLDTVTLLGEPIPQSLADVWASKVRLLNGYGPSECGPISTMAHLPPGKKVSIGRPLKRVSVYVLDHRQCLVPQGVIGEIYIAGEQITKGYWNAAQQTSNPFIPNHVFPEPDKTLMYRTGDLAFWNEDMTLSYVGRIDNQVKVRGFRIELEEIERALLLVKGVKIQNAAAITAISEEHDMRVVAFVTPEDVDTNAVRAELRTLLPAYARPAQIIALPAIPKSSSQKVDRKALLALATSRNNGEASRGQEKSLMGSLTSTERFIAGIWKQLLSLDTDFPVRKDDDFLVMGGNSILAIKAARLITSSIGHPIPVALLIRETILDKLATAIDNFYDRSSPPNNSFSSYLLSTKHMSMAGHSLPTAPLSYLEYDMFRAHAASDTKSAFHTVVQFLVKGSYNPSALVEAFTALVRENPVLRSRYIISQKKPTRLISPQTLGPQCYTGDELSREKLQELVDEPFDLAKDQPVRAFLWIGNGQKMETEIIMVTHHLVTDKASLMLMLQWMSRRYQQLTSPKVRSVNGHLTNGKTTNGHTTSGHTANEHTANGQEDTLTRNMNNKTIESTYIDWAQWIQTQEEESSASASPRAKRIDFWRHYLHKWQPIAPLHPSSSSSSSYQKAGSNHSFHIPHPDQAAPAATPGLKYSQRLAVAATALTLKSIYGTSDMVLGLPYMNRDDASTVEMLGLFVDQLPIRISLVDDEKKASADMLLANISTEINLALANQLPYAVIKSALESASSSANTDIQTIVDVMIVYHWQSDAYERSLDLGPDAHVCWPARSMKPTGALFPLVLEFVEQEDGSLRVDIEYNTQLVYGKVMTTIETLLPYAMQRLAHGQLP